eukprot:Sspe_Gene.41691::Locus_20171_Transcript_1_1_Confidence_1.000_Length_2975::g.41691::m.41691
MSGTDGVFVVYENQRYIPVKGWCPSQRLRHEWTDPAGNGPVDRESLEAPPGREWTGDWHVDDAVGDREGWEYALDFPLTFHRERHVGDCVRRRRWVREYRVVDEEKESLDTSWPDDAKVGHCMRCVVQFTVFRRKHRCRRCGAMVCDECSGHRMSIPGYGNEQRVCDLCFKNEGGDVIVAGRGAKTSSLTNKLKELKGNAAATHLLVAGKMDAVHIDDDDATQRSYTPRDDEVVGEVAVRVFEAKGLAGKLDISTPNPMVVVRVCGVLVRTSTKAQTHNPKWGASEGSFTIPVRDPTASVFFIAYDVFPGPGELRKDRAIGRAAVPLPLVMVSGGCEAWLELLPLPSGQSPEVRFRGCSPVSSKFGLRTPDAPVGYVRMSIQWTPLVRAKCGILPAYFTSPAIPEDMQKDSFDVDVVRDNASRVAASVGTPALLVMLWDRPFLAWGIAPLWVHLCWEILIWQIPYAAAAIIVLNGALSGAQQRAMRETGLVLFEEENPYNEPSLWTKINRIPFALKAVQRLQNPLGEAATWLSKASALFSFDDAAVSCTAIAMLLLLATVASLLLMLLSHIPLRIHVGLLGAMVLVLPTLFPTLRTSEAESEAESSEPAPPPHPVLARFSTYLRNFISHVPDDRELVHRLICSKHMHRHLPAEE